MSLLVCRIGHAACARKAATGISARSTRHRHSLLARPGSCCSLPSTLRLHRLHPICQRRTFFGKIRSAVRTILAGDDHLNPKKLLERRYIYLSLLAMEFRKLRLQQHSDSDNSEKKKKQQLYEDAVELLDEKNLDEMSNERLRMELQDALQPQVVDLFQTFHQVDQELQLHQLMDHQNDKNSFHSLDWDHIVAILEQERSDLANRSTSEATEFFRTAKGQALDTLLEFHATGHITPHNNDAFGNDTTTLAPSSLKLMRQYQSINMARSARLRDKLGYSVISLRSSISNAGRGVFVDGMALAGSLVAFQPGDIWPKEHLLTTAQDVMDHFDDDDEDCHISLRFDDYVVDSRQAPVTVLLGDYVGDANDDDEPATRSGSSNPWALGHMVNHPAPSMQPNGMSAMLDFTERTMVELARMTTDQQVHRYLPNVYARAPSWKSRVFYAEPIVMHGLCLLARQDVCDHELVYDYRLQSDVTPEWYTVAESGIMKEEQVVFFRDDWVNKT